MNDCSFIAKSKRLTYIVIAMKAAIKKRTAPKEERQQQLIQATIRSVASNGMSDTTMATVSREAGLSQGIINLHFQSKDRLLVETLRFLSEQYQSAWEKAVSKAGDDPADKLAAMVATDFKPPVCDRNKLAVWFAFWGESKSRPTYRKICALRDMAYRVEMVQVCEELVEKGGYQDIDAGAVCMSYLATTFPRHFSEKSTQS